MIKLMLTSIALLLLFIPMKAAMAEEIYLEKGEARTLNTSKDIDTVFISAPDVADYEIINTREVMIYAKSDGKAQLVIYGGENGQTLMTVNLVVDPVLGKLTTRVQNDYPGSQIDITKYGAGYVLSGIVPNEEARDNIYMIVGEAMGLKRKDIEATYDDNLSTDGKGEKTTETINILGRIVYEGLVNRLKLPSANQVNVKLSVVEVTKEFMDNLGVDWSNTGSTGIFNLTKFKLDATSLTNMIYALKQDAVARVLAEPNLSVISGETAEFLVGGEIPVVTSSQNGTNVEYKEFGVKLAIAAKVEHANKIRLWLSQEISNIDGEYQLANAHSIPKLRTRKAKTTIELSDGDSFVLGGLLDERERESLSRIPWIGDIPVLGALFRNTGSSRSRTELVVVATVNLVKPISQRQITLPNYTRSNLAERFFNVSAIDENTTRKQVTEFLNKGGFSQ